MASTPHPGPNSAPYSSPAPISALSDHQSPSTALEVSEGTPTLSVNVYPIRPTGCPDANFVPYTVLVHSGAAYSMAQVVFGCGLDSPVERFVRPPSRAQLRELPDTSTAEIIRLSWTSLISVPFEFTVDSSCVDVRLYHDVLRYLESTYTPSSLVGAVKGSFRKPLSQFHPSFGTLVNCLADRYSIPGHPTPAELNVSLYATSALDFIIYGMLYVVAMNDYIETIEHRIGRFVALMEQSKTTSRPSMLYQAAFLDIVTPLWHRECWDRHRVRWSPMPWSQVSLRILEEEQFRVMDTTDMIRTPSASALDKLDDEDLRFRFTQYMCGHPIDISWLGAPHDGYPFSMTLSSYVGVRRAQMAPSLREDAALWLGALTFGVLEAVLNLRVPEALALSKRDGKEVISGARMARLMYTWQIHTQDHRSLDLDAHLRRGREVAQLLDDALLAIDEVQWHYGDPFIRAGAPFARALQEFIGPTTLAVLALCSHGGLLWPEVPAFYTQIIRNAGRLYHTFAEIACQKYMTNVGWCPYIVSRTFLAILQRPHLLSLIHFEPYIRNSPNEHQHCTDESCDLYNITDTSTYVPRHTDPSCHCSYIIPPSDDVTRLLSEGDHGTIPVVVFDGHRLSVQRATDHPYVAISHVWADGLGSTTEKGLPGCQVARLTTLAQNLKPESGAFWMDSLCVPEVKDLRKRAIKLMAKTYEDAASVLVIDACIRNQCHSQSKLWQENLFRIATSGWVRRVWTLQEGLLARRLYFEFADGPVDVDEKMGDMNMQLEGMKYQPIANLMENTASERLLPVHYAGCLPLIAFRGKKSGAAARECTLGDIIGLLRLRTTSKAEDETIAIAGLLPQVDVGVLLAIGGREAVEMRMKTFLLQLREIPRFFPLLNDPKIDIPGFRWAPRTLATVFNSDSRSYGTATCTEDGLHGEYNIIRFHTAVQMPSSLTVGTGHDKRPEFVIWIMDHASESVYEAKILLARLRESAHRHTESTMSRPSAINALLFILRDSLENKSTGCAAVLCRTGVAGGDETNGSPLYCDHVSTGRFHRIATKHEVFEKTYGNDFGSAATKGEFGKAHICLT